VQRQYWNAFKHATERREPHEERADDELLKRFTDENNDIALVIGWSDYHRATGKIPIEAQVQQTWYFALHPEKHGDPELAHASTIVSLISAPSLAPSRRGCSMSASNGCGRTSLRCLIREPNNVLSY
jgi:hypothetical protein